jgi:1,4-alpha-glucan branching enzyme
VSLFSKFFKRSRESAVVEYISPVTFLNPHSTLGELDFHLISEGRHERLWDVLGAHLIRDESEEIIGTAFSVWAPNAHAVSLIGDHNFWDKNTHPMVRLGSSGIWEVFIPGIGIGTRYKFAICTINGTWVDHADPLAQATETPPLTASVVTESSYSWGDQNWMNARSDFQPWRSPVSVYEVHLGSWKIGLS